MRIGIVGSGEVALALAAGYTSHGHEVRIGSRDASRPELAIYAPAAAAEIAEWAELVVLCVNGKVAVEVISSIASAVAGKIVIDTTNPIDFSVGMPLLFTGPGDSLGAQIQTAVPDTHVVKAYNSVGNAFMVDPDLPGGPPTMFIAGDDAEAKRVVTGLLESTGWDVADYGGIESCHAIEPLVLTWSYFGFANGTWNHAFKLLRH